MLIKRLLLKDFLVYKEADIDFENISLTTIVGKWESDSRKSNGAGKSALLEAIPFALYGTTRTKAAKAIVRHGAKKCMVELTVDLGGTELRVRRHRGTDSSCAVWVDGECISRQAKAVDQVVRERVGVDKELFEVIYYFRQDQQHQFVDSTPGDRKAVLSKVFDLSKLQRCCDLAKARHKECNEKATELQGSISTLELQIEELGTEEKLQNFMLDASEDYASAYVQLQSVNEHLQQAEDSKHVLLNEWREFEGKLDDVLAEHGRVQFSIIQAQRQQVNLKQSVEANRRLLDRNKKVSKDIAQQLSSVNGTTPQDIEAQYKLVEHLKAQSAGEMTLVFHLNEFLAHADGMAGQRCPTCKQDVSPEHIDETVKAHTALVDKHKSNISELDERLDIESKKLAELDKAKQIADKHRQLTAEKVEADSVVKHMSKAVKVDTEQIDRLNNAVREDTLKLADLRAALNEHDLTAMEQSAKVATNGMCAVIGTCRGVFDDTQQELNRSLQCLVAFDESIKARRKLVAKRQKQDAELAKCRKDADVYKCLIAAFSKDGIQAIMIENIVSVIEQFANEILAQMQTKFTVQMRTQKETTAGELRETLDINVYDNGADRLYETYSGGERTLINLALRLALSRVVSSLNNVEVGTLFLDEVLAPLDEVNREEVVKIVSYLSKNFRQVFVISHTEMANELVPNHIAVIRKSSGYSEVVIDGTEEERAA